MRFNYLQFLGAIALAAVPADAAAGQNPADDQAAALRQCVALQTSGADRIAVARWMFVALSSSPHIQDLARTDPAKKAQLDGEFRRIFVRLVNQDCLTQVKPLAANNLKDAFGMVGEALGEVAMQELMTNDKVTKSLESWADSISEGEFKPLTDSLPKKP